ncbi:MAG: lyase [Nitrosopumilus sp.]|nr:lyase [Nitrosopumilus sp.]MDH3489562.1 lyase [Nitrosopumilus sp.]MDH3516560.1 lyase [Nitrosopumilus sp.]MDH3565027.1 lyase [Nitrosopumilus sp.]MDH5416450.1 lyase [Nitrosopumilus sp.]
MKKIGVVVSIFFATIMLTSLTAGVLLNNTPTSSENSEITITGTPADNFPDAQRAQFCGSNTAKSTDYVQEFSIPTLCTNPLAIVTDYDGNVWFTQTNTGKVAKFDPNTQIFTEYDNPLWPKGGRSMMWGIDYAPDGSVWFTDETYDSVWKFSTLDEKYERLSYPSEGNSLPQKLQVYGSQIIINDFTGNKLTFLDPTQSGDEINYLSIPSPVDDSVTADFALDASNNVWFTNWLFQQGGVLVKFDQNGYFNAVSNSKEQLLPLLDFIEIFELPVELLTPNGSVVANDGTIWLADTTSSYFFNFDPVTKEFTQYVTSDPLLDTYGNQTGIVKTPISRPYWIESDDQGRIVFNTQTANNIAVMDPESQSLVEYHVPSKNPYWGDCDPGTGMMLADCGIAQIFDFTVDGTKIWFTEWVENNIGVVDTSIELPLDIQLGSNTLTLSPGDSKDFEFIISPKSQKDLLGISLILSSTRDFLNIDLLDNTPESFQLDSNTPYPITTIIHASDDAEPGIYKILVGVQTSDVAISKFITVTIE